MPEPTGELVPYEGVLKMYSAERRQDITQRLEGAVAHLGEVVVLRELLEGQSEATQAAAMLDTIDGANKPEALLAILQGGQRLADPEVRNSFFLSYADKLLEKVNWGWSASRHHYTGQQEQVDASSRNVPLYALVIETLGSEGVDPDEARQRIEPIIKLPGQSYFDEIGLTYHDYARVYVPATRLELTLLEKTGFQTEHFETAHRILSPVHYSFDQITGHTQTQEQASRYLLTHADDVDPLRALSAMRAVVTESTNPDLVFSAIEKSMERMPLAAAVVAASKTELDTKETELLQAKKNWTLFNKHIIGKKKKALNKEQRETHFDAVRARDKAQLDYNLQAQSLEWLHADVYKTPLAKLLFFTSEERGQALIQSLVDSLDDDHKDEYVAQLGNWFAHSYKEFAEGSEPADQKKTTEDGAEVGLLTRQNLTQAYYFLKSTFDIEVTLPS